MRKLKLELLYPFVLQRILRDGGLLCLLYDQLYAKAEICTVSLVVWSETCRFFRLPTQFYQRLPWRALLRIVCCDFTSFCNFCNIFCKSARLKRSSNCSMMTPDFFVKWKNGKSWNRNFISTRKKLQIPTRIFNTGENKPILNMYLHKYEAKTAMVKFFAFGASCAFSCHWNFCCHWNFSCYWNFLPLELSLPLRLPLELQRCR